MNLKQILFFSIFITFGFFQACQGQNKSPELKNIDVKYKLSKTEKANLNRIIDSIYALDQGKRYALKRIDTAYGVAKTPYFSRDKVLGDKYKEYKTKRDSLWKVTASINDTNTQQLIQITKKHGFPNNRRLGRYKSKAYMIFVHSPRKYFSKIRKLISKEYKGGRINEYKKEYIFWHLNGRNGMPPMSGKNGEAVWVENQNN